MGKAMRLDKLLGHTGWGTRKELKDLCKGGQVTVNGDICRDSSRKVDPEADVVAVGGEIVSYEEYIYLMLYKPAGVVSATEDNVSQTVLDLLPRRYRGSRLFPVGRLDKDTTGLLFLTNDGTWLTALRRRKNISQSVMNRRRRRYPRRYRGTLRRRHRPCGRSPLPAGRSAADRRSYDCVVVEEGKFHQVKRMCAAVGLTVAALHRRSYRSGLSR